MSKRDDDNKNEAKEETLKQEPTTSSNQEMDDFDRILQEYMDKILEEEANSSAENEETPTATPNDESDSTQPSILDCPQATKIIHTLNNCGWETDTEAIDENILIASKGDYKLAIYLYYGKGDSNSWIAAEDDFEGEVPLWFSDCEHTKSPVYEVTNYALRTSSINRQYHATMVILMYPNYITNAEGILEQWVDTAVVSIERFCRLAEAGEDIYYIETDVEDLSAEPSLKQRYEIDEYEIPEDETEEDDEEEEGIAPNDGIDTDSEEFTEIEIEDVLLATEPVSNSTIKSTPSKATHFRSEPNILLLMWLKIKGDIHPDAEYTFELRDSNSNTISIDTRAITKEKDRLMCLLLDKPLVGSYWLNIRHNGNRLYCKRVTFVDIEQGCDKYIDLESFGLYRIDMDEMYCDHSTIMKRGMKSCFDCENFGGVLITPQFRNISGKSMPYQFILTIENEKGEMVYEGEESGTLDADEQYVFASDVTGVVCPIGLYTINVKFLGEVVLVTDFVVGERDVRTTFRISQLKTRASKIEAEKIRIADPMKELNSMIGLDSLKIQLRKLIAKIKMDQLREAQGLPVKKQQLHMAFLGNPGTGKTTVAKLLGQIYKDIGVLSKGQVVMEDRTTLMTQNWGGEGEMVNQALERAKGGILFIDEAYDLVTEHKTDPGKLIISALLQAMADESKRDFMVIFAGYTRPMERLLSKNPGLRSRLTSMYFDDYKVPELMQITDSWLGKNCYKLTADARKYFESIVSSAYASRNENFGNARFVVNLLENEVQPAMAERVMEQDSSSTSLSMLTTIEACDIPNYNAVLDGATEAIAKLDNMIGLNELKKQIRSHLSLIRFVQSRRDNKIDTQIPPLHMVFTGNPGTGKTSVAEYLGDIYRSMGILSVGNVIKVTRADMIDSAIGGTEEKMKELINAAHGNILFIDEAYTLFSKSGNDFGKNAIEVLLDTLSKENIDMIVILAGYPKEMEELLNINPGLKGRFPHTFNFEDYNEDELFEIAEGVAKRNSLTLSKGAAEALRALIRKECKIKDNNFSNARFVVRLITTQVLPNMAMRLEGETDPTKLQRILQRDIPIEHDEIRMINDHLFDEEMIEEALERLDAMVGLTKVKTAIHQFVDFARALNRKDPTQIERHPLKWSFVGNTGTGKSSIAEILSTILKAMHLLGKGHTVEVKAEELYGVATHKADELLQQRMRESLQGLLFVDGDAPQLRAAHSSFNPEYLRVCLAVNTAEIRGRFAVVIAEQNSQAVGLTKSLNKIGISNFNHTLIFDDYTADELMEIFILQLQKQKLSLSAEAATIMHGYITRLLKECGASDANARTMKELAAAIWNMATPENCGKNQTIQAEAVAIFATLQPPRTKIGY